MARTCRFTFGERSGAAEWSYDGSYLVVTPDKGSPISLSLAEIAGVGGDGYTLQLKVPAAAGPGGGIDSSAAATAADGVRAELLLSHLGAEGPTLLERLRREWIVARAEVLRLGGSGEGEPFTGRVSGLGDGSPPAGETPVDGSPQGGSPQGGSPQPFHALLFEDVLVVAPEGRDLEPVFLALLGTVEFDEPAYSVRVRQWPGQEVLFSKMAGQTDEFLRALRENRAQLTAESGAALATALPTLPTGPRGALAGMWLPGRLLEIEAMETVCPGFGKALREQWLAGLVRRAEAEHLLKWASGGSSWLGLARESARSSGETGDEGSPLWLLCGKGGVWFLEALSSEDRATYCFTGGEEIPALVARLLCAPQFSREALHSPIGELVGEKADLAIPAQCLGFLVALRERFRDRVIHQTIESWQKGVDELGGAGAADDPSG